MLKRMLLFLICLAMFIRAQTGIAETLDVHYFEYPP